MKCYFITATGTGIGKTMVGCTLLWQLRQSDYDARVIKPVISGYNEESQDNDTQLLLRSQGISPTAENINKISPWRFHAALSPDLAAREENIKVEFADIVGFCCKEMDKKPDYLLIEGAGGVMSPLTEHHTNLDLISALEMPVVLVSGVYLGAVTHTLCAIEVLRARNVDISAVVVSAGNAEGEALEQTQDMLARFISPAIPLHAIPRLDFREELWKHALDMTYLLV